MGSQLRPLGKTRRPLCFHLHHRRPYRQSCGRGSSDVRPVGRGARGDRLDRAMTVRCGGRPPKGPRTPTPVVGHPRSQLLKAVRTTRKRRRHARTSARPRPAGPWMAGFRRRRLGLIRPANPQGAAERAASDLRAAGGSGGWFLRQGSRQQSVRPVRAGMIQPAWKCGMTPEAP